MPAHLEEGSADEWYQTHKLAVLYQAGLLQDTKWHRDAQSIIRVLRGSGALLWELEVTGSRGIEAAGQRRRSFPLFFSASEMQLNLGQNLWAVLALFMLFPTHLSDKKQVMLWSQEGTQGAGLSIVSALVALVLRLSPEVSQETGSEVSAASVSLKAPALHCGVNLGFVDAGFLGLLC